MSEFIEFDKIARLSRPCVITEKIDGTNAQVYIVEAMDPSGDVAAAEEHVIARNASGDVMFAGSRSRYITPSADNFGFARWVKEHAAELWTLGPGRHFGEWWGSGVQRGYGLQNGEKRFSLFNVARWHAERDREKFPVDPPSCCHVVPVILRSLFTTEAVEVALGELRAKGSFASPGFTRPEGVVIWHEAARVLLKKTLEKDDEPKHRGEKP